MIYAHFNRCGYLYDIFNRVASIGKVIVNYKIQHGERSSDDK